MLVCVLDGHILDFVRFVRLKLADVGRKFFRVVQVNYCQGTVPTPGPNRAEPAHASVFRFFLGNMGNIILPSEGQVTIMYIVHSTG